MAASPGGARITETPDVPDPIARALERLLPPHIGPSRMEKIFDEYEFEPSPLPMPRQHMLADAGDDSPALMEISRLLAEDQVPRPTRIDLSGMPGPRGRGEVTRFDMPAIALENEPQTVNRDAKRDSLATVETPGMMRGIAQEGIGQAMLLGYGDDIEGFLSGRHPEDIRRERLAFGDANPEAALAANVGGIAAGGLGGRAIRALMGGARAADDLDEATPRFEPDVRQAMRNAEGIESASKSQDELVDQLQRLLSNPEARLDIQGKPLELSPADIFAMTAGAETSPSEPIPDELGLSSMSPVDRLRAGLEIGHAAGQNLTEDEKARNAAVNQEALFSVLPVIGNWMAARDAGNEAGAASAAFSRGDTKAALMHSALAALSATGARTGAPLSRAADRAVEGASSRAGVFVPVEDARKIDDVLSRRADDQPLRQIYHDTGAFISPSGRPLREVSDVGMETGMGRFKPGDQATLGEYADHPIFEQFPQYRDIPVTFTDAVDVRGGAPIARTLPEGGAELSLAPGDARKGVAKVLQYNIEKDLGLPPALRHGKGELMGAFERAQRAMADVKPQSKADLDALMAYVEGMTRRRDDLLRNLEMVDPKKSGNLVQIVTNKNEGNVNARVVGGRATLDQNGLNQIYPYNKQTPYFKRGGTAKGRGITDFEDMFTLPPEGASPDDLLEFLRAWRAYGSGRPAPE